MLKNIYICTGEAVLMSKNDIDDERDMDSHITPYLPKIQLWYIFYLFTES
jgi:hypothetical protein